MKIERISDNQIKCTLSRSDLASRQIKISELAYGTEKTKGLFHDMMEQAENEFGFEANDAPLMIEAIPISMDSIVLMITRVDDPDEVDPKYADFTKIQSSDDEDDDDDLSYLLDDKSFKEILENDNKRQRNKFQPSESTKNLTVIEKIFSFDSLDSVIDFAHQINGRYDGTNSLYKSKDNGKYFLYMEKSRHSIKDFVSICDSALEYGKREQLSYARSAFIQEHCELITENSATQTLARL